MNNREIMMSSIHDTRSKTASSSSRTSYSPTHLLYGVWECLCNAQRRGSKLTLSSTGVFFVKGVTSKINECSKRGKIYSIVELELTDDSLFADSDKFQCRPFRYKKFGKKEAEQVLSTVRPGALIYVQNCVIRFEPVYNGSEAVELSEGTICALEYDYTSRGYAYPQHARPVDAALVERIACMARWVDGNRNFNAMRTLMLTKTSIDIHQSSMLPAAQEPAPPPALEMSFSELLVLSKDSRLLLEMSIGQVLLVRCALVGITLRPSLYGGESDDAGYSSLVRVTRHEGDAVPCVQYEDALIEITPPPVTAANPHPASSGSSQLLFSYSSFVDDEPLFIHVGDAAMEGLLGIPAPLLAAQQALLRSGWDHSFLENLPTHSLADAAQKVLSGLRQSCEQMSVFTLALGVRAAALKCENGLVVVSGPVFSLIKLYKG